MNGFALFTDVSLNPERKLGVGAYRCVPASFLEISPHNLKRSEVVGQLAVQRFAETSSTQLEVRTVLWALEAYRNAQKDSGTGKLSVYSDSQCVAGLLKRRSGLEGKGFLGKRTNRLIKNAALYRKFYELHDELGFEVIKVKGHSRSSSHDTVHRIFSIVDKQVRKALKTWMEELTSATIDPHAG